MWSGLRGRIVLIAAVAVLPALALIVYGQTISRQQDRQKIVDDNLRLARLAASEEASEFVNAQRLMRTLSHVPDIPDSLQECRIILQSIVDDHPGFLNIGVVDRNGDMMCSSASVASGTRFDDRPWFQQAVRSRTTAVSDRQIGRTTGMPDIVIAEPVIDRAGALSHVLAVAIDATRFERIASDFRLPVGTTLTLFDRTRTIVARSPAGGTWIGRRVDAPSIVGWMRAPRSALVAEDAGVDGVRRLYVTVPVDAGFETGLFMGLGVDETLAFAQDDALYHGQLTMLLLIAAIVVAAALALGHTFVLKPVNALRAMTARLAAGEFSARTQLTGGIRELNRLGDDIDVLASALGARKQERDAAERALRASEDRYRLLFEENPHPMWVFDRDTLAFLEVNDAAVAHYGYTRDEFLAMRITDIRPPEDVERLVESLESDRSTWNRSAGWRHRKKSGEIVDVEVTAHRLTFDGRPAEIVTAQDITERRRAETALAERTALTALLADIGVSFNRPHPIAACLQDCAEALVAYVGASCARIWTMDDGEGRLELQGRAGDCATGVPGDVVALVESGPTSLAQRIVHERRSRFSNDVVADYDLAPADCCRHGEMIGFAGCPLITDGRVVGVMTLLLDRPLSEPISVGLANVAEHIALGITRLRAEQARRLLASIVTSSEDAIIATTLDGTIASWNVGAERLYGYTPDEAIGQPIAIIYPAERLDEFADFIDRIHSGAPVVHCETVRRRKDGGEVTVALTVSPVKDLNGRITGKSVIVRDMTERKAAERSAREVDERMRFALEASNVGVWEANLKTGASYWSETCERMHGLAAGTFGRTMDAFAGCIHQDDRDRVASAISKAIAEHKDVGLEYQTRWPDGTVRLISSVGRITYDEKGAPTRAAGITLDITDRRSLEDQLRQAQKMEAIGQLAGGIAHDFNNLLTAILGFSGFLAESMADDDERRQDVEEIKNAADRAAILTRQLLAFGRKQILATRVMHIGDVVGELTPMLRRLTSEAIDLRTTIGDRGLVKADPGQLQQVLVNLVVNARDAMPDGGHLTIETSDAQIDDAFVRRHPWLQPGAYVLLHVRDTGCGMDEATLSRIFEPFFTTKPKGQGTGLGLATVYGIVKQSGGAIWVDSEVGRGTTFSVCLPRTDEREASEDAHAAAAPAGRGDETVLLVEDEDVVREFVYKVLTRKGYSVHALPDPQRAIEYAEAHRAPIDLVFTDVVLPEMNGKVMVTRLRAGHPESKVLYMSGYDDNAIVQHGVLEIDTELLQKPFTADALARKVRDVLDA